MMAKRHAGMTNSQWLIAILAILISLNSAVSQSLPIATPSALGGPRFLPVDQAFSYYTSLPAPGVLSVHWEVAPGYYLYQDKFKFSVLVEGVAQEFSLDLPQASSHNDEFFGDVQVYFDDMAAKLNFADAVPKGEIVLLIEYQGCAEAGFCYTEQHREIPLAL